MIDRFGKAEIFAISAGLMMAVLILALHQAQMFQFQIFAGPAASFLVSGMLAWITWQDVADFSVPDGPMIAVAVVGAAVRFAAAPGEPLWEALLIALDVFVCGGGLLLVREAYFRLRGVDGLGFGDVKLAAAVGILIGATGFAWALFIASVSGLLLVLCASIFARNRKIERLPFGAFLAPVCWGLWMLTP